MRIVHASSRAANAARHCGTHTSASATGCHCGRESSAAVGVRRNERRVVAQRSELDRGAILFVVYHSQIMMMTDDASLPAVTECRSAPLPIHTRLYPFVLVREPL